MNRRLLTTEVGIMLLATAGMSQAQVATGTLTQAQESEQESVLQEDKIAAKQKAKETAAEKAAQERADAWSAVSTGGASAAAMAPFTGEKQSKGQHRETSHEYTVLGTVVSDGKTYRVVKNPWRQAVAVEQSATVQRPRTKPLYVKRDGESVDSNSDAVLIEQALAYCKAMESTDEICGFTVAPACPPGWQTGKSFIVESKAHTACIGADASSKK